MTLQQDLYDPECPTKEYPLLVFDNGIVYCIVVITFVVFMIHIHVYMYSSCVGICDLRKRMKRV